MFHLECLCRFRNVWTQTEGVPEFPILSMAIIRARFLAAQNRRAYRVVDDAGTIRYNALP